MTPRPAVAADLARVESIVRDGYSHYIERLGKPPGPMLDDYADLIARRVVVLAEDAGRIMGLIVLLDRPDHLLLDNVVVDPAFQGRGVGRALMAHAEDEARRRGYAAIRLYTHEKMTENIAIYLRAGFHETGRAEQAGYARVFFTKILS